MRKLIFNLLMVLAVCAVTPDASAAEFNTRFVAASEPELSNPHDVDLSPTGKHLYVSDLGHNRVAVLDARSLKLLGAIGEKDDLSAPHDVHIGPDGRLYVADTGNDRVVIYEIDGVNGKKVGELAGGFYAPEGVFAQSENRVYVTGAGSGNIVVFENNEIAGEAKGLRAPHDVIADRAGSFWVADSANDRMVLMSRDLKTKKVLEGEPYKFKGPRYQDMTDDGLLVVADKNTHSIKVISPDGELITVIGDGKRGKGPGKFTTPEGVVIRGDDIWFADSGNNRIVRYRRVR
ncbi:MAG: NHL repeat-containing protein [Hyphomicrobiaceae bacterium]|nr:NHL repeat-containing protein [Hyphomicrobiaceae bacterium]